MERRDKSVRFKDISIALIIAYIIEHIEDAFVRFLHLYTNTVYPPTDLSPGIIAGMIASVGIVGMGKKANAITSSFFATGIILFIIAIYNNIVYGEEIDYDEIVKRFIIDGSTIAIILYIYFKIIDAVQLKQKIYYCGDFYRVVYGVIRNFPIAIYFGYRAFVSNIEAAKEEAKKQEEKDQEITNKDEDSIVKSK